MDCSTFRLGLGRRPPCSSRPISLQLLLEMRLVTPCAHESPQQNLTDFTARRKAPTPKIWSKICTLTCLTVHLGQQTWLCLVGERLYRGKSAYKHVPRLGFVKLATMPGPTKAWRHLWCSRAACTDVEGSSFSRKSSKSQEEETDRAIQHQNPKPLQIFPFSPFPTRSLQLHLRAQYPCSRPDGCHSTSPCFHSKPAKHYYRGLSESSSTRKPLPHL